MGDVRLFVMLWIGHLPVKIILVDRLEYHRQNSCAAAGHLFDVVSVSEYQSLPQRNRGINDDVWLQISHI